MTLFSSCILGTKGDNISNAAGMKTFIVVGDMADFVRSAGGVRLVIEEFRMAPSTVQKALPKAYILLYVMIVGFTLLIALVLYGDRAIALLKLLQDISLLLNWPEVILCILLDYMGI